MSTANISIDDRQLRDALRGIERPMLMEPSVKSVAGTLITGRYLISFPRAALGPGPSRKLRDILEALGAPAEGVARLDQMQSSSQSVHFGYEPDPNGTLLKCYLEFSLENRPHPDLTFIALKWAPDGRFAVTLYHDRDALSATQQSELVHEVLPAGHVRDTFLALMAHNLGRGSLCFLEVTEPGNPRRSIDLNLAETSVTLAHHHEALLNLLGGGDEVDAYLKAHASEALGHIAAGTTRDGVAFGTLYHGAHRVLGAL